MPGFRFNRRAVLNIALAGGALPAAVRGTAPTDGQPQPLQVIDTNVSLFHWPFRRLPLDTTEALVGKLRSLGIVRSWAGSFEAILHRDVVSVNARLMKACRDIPDLIPMGSLNPTLPNWTDDLRRCSMDFGMPGIRLHPNYHRYSLDDVRFSDLLKRATDAGLLIQIAAAMEDTRTQHPSVVVPDVDLSPLPQLLRSIPGARVQVLNARLRPEELKRLADAPGIFFDTSRVEGTDGVPLLVNCVPDGRVLFGSHAPFLIPEAALIRVHESGQLSQTSLSAVLSGNARSLLGDAR